MHTHRFSAHARPQTPTTQVRSAETLRRRVLELRNMSASPGVQANRTGTEAAAADSVTRVRELASGLVSVGFSRTEAERRVRAALESLSPRSQEVDEPELIRMALSGTKKTARQPPVSG